MINLPSRFPMVNSWHALFPSLSRWLEDKGFWLFPALVFLLLILGFSPWSGLDPIYGLPIFQVSGWSLVFIISSVFLVLGTAWLQFSLAKTENLSAALTSAFIFFGVGLLLLSSQNALAVLLAWGLLDLAFLWITVRSAETSAGLSLRAARWNLIGMLGWLVFAFSGFGGAWVLLAVWVRLGVYPAMQILSSFQEVAWPARSIFQFVAIIAGGYLLAQYPGMAMEGLLQIVVVLLALLAIAWGIFFLWREEDRSKTGLYIYQVQLGFFLLAVASGLTLPPSVAFLSILSTALGWVLFDAASRTSTAISRHWLNMIPISIAVANWLGLPLTPGFSSRLWVYGSLLREGKVWLLAVGLASLVLIFPPLARTVLAGFSSNGVVDSRNARIWLWLLTLATFVLGIYPDTLLSLAGPSEPQITPLSLARILPPPLLFWLLLLILAPLFIGFFILRFGGRLKVEGRYLETISRLLDLEWLYSSLRGGEDKLGSILRRLSAFGEGRGAWGWTLFLALLI
ncbi:MAG: hypothetical protein HYX86_04610, partial [Chloroflexi bacterium]|nr:hypothetical protein [Chloroflexota bacterium]